MPMDSWRPIRFAIHPRRRGFSLVEVVISLGIVALAVPVMLAMFGFFSQTSSQAVNREEAARAFTAISLFLNGNALDASTQEPLGMTAGAGTTPSASFDTVLGWIQAAKPVLVYAYKSPSLGNTASTTAAPSGYLVSMSAPAAGQWSGTLLVGEIKPLTVNGTTSFLPPAVLSPSTTPNTYTKSYIPVEVSIYARAGAVAAQATPPANALIDSYPAIVSR